MAGLLKTDEIANAAGTGPVSASNGILSSKSPVFLATASLASTTGSSLDVAQVAFTTTLTDTNSGQVGSNTYQIPVGCGGFYNIIGNANVSPNGAGPGTVNMEVRVYSPLYGFNVAPVPGNSTGVPDAGQIYNLQVICAGLLLKEGDFVQLCLNQNTAFTVTADVVLGIQRILAPKV